MNNKLIRKIIIVFPLVTVCFYCIFHDELSVDSSPVFTVSMSLASVLSIIVLFYLLYSITGDTMKSARREAELLVVNEQEKIKEQQSQSLKERRQQTLSLQEQMKKDLLTYENLMDNGLYDEAASYLENLTSRFQKERFHPICSDNLVSAILDSKRQIASQYHIRTSFQLLLPENIKLENSDLSSIFFNLMDNGIESCRNSHASDPFIQITANQNANFLTIHMTNSKDPSSRFNHKTTKTDS